MSSTCSRCGRPLSDPASVAAGIGPECKEREENHGFTERELRRAIAYAVQLRRQQQQRKGLETNEKPEAIH